MSNIKKLIILLPFLISCATTTDSGSVGVNRKQILLISSDQVNQMALANFKQVKSDAQAKNALDTNSSQVKRVTSIAQRLIPHTAIFRKDAPSWAWETHVITSSELNAYCMPGGKIVFYSGIIEKLNMTDGEIAAVMGHEIAHALREHGRERVSTGLMQQLGIESLMALTGADPKYAGLISSGSNLLLTLPHGRNQESEADQMGLELMARAGYNPQEAVRLWQKMSSQGGGKPPEILSTHPSDENRISQIQNWMPRVLPLYKASRTN